MNKKMLKMFTHLQKKKSYKVTKILCTFQNKFSIFQEYFDTSIEKTSIILPLKIKDKKYMLLLYKNASPPVL